MIKDRSTSQNHQNDSSHDCLFSKFDVNSQSNVSKYLLNRLDISRLDECLLIPVY